MPAQTSVLQVICVKTGMTLQRLPATSRNRWMTVRCSRSLCAKPASSLRTICDFGELIFRHGLGHAGVIYFRLEETSIGAKLTGLERVLTDHADDLIHFIVVSEQGTHSSS